MHQKIYVVPFFNLRKGFKPAQDDVPAAGRIELGEELIQGLPAWNKKASGPPEECSHL